MQLFPQRQQKQALAFAAEGGQALHLSGYWRVPGRKEPTECAHLFDQDRERLVEMARILGVRAVKVEHEAEPGQHVDLWGQPLRAALEVAADETRRRIREKLRTCADCGALVPPGRGAFATRRGKEVLVCAGDCRTKREEA